MSLNYQRNHTQSFSAPVMTKVCLMHISMLECVSIFFFSLVSYKVDSNVFLGGGTKTWQKGMDFIHNKILFKKTFRKRTRIFNKTQNQSHISGFWHLSVKPLARNLYWWSHYVIYLFSWDISGAFSIRKLKVK